MEPEMPERTFNLHAYPLCWPEGWKRTVAGQRRNAQFSKRETQYRTNYQGQQQSWTTKKYLTVSDGVGRILDSLGRMGIDSHDVVVSTNVRTRLDGLPRSGEKEPADPGAAVYWRKGHDGRMRCIAVDHYTTVADNLAAIAATLEAMRAIERHGGAEILDRTFQGFAALPQTTEKSWREVLDIPYQNVTVDQIETRFRTLAKTHHPDAGGDTARFQEIAAARDAALAEVRA